MIYYVEDDKNIRDLVVYTLAQTGFDAQGFEDGAAFWSACAAQPPELVLLDIMLPREDGLSILAQLRQDPATAQLPVMMITAKGAEYDKVVGLDSGADDYLTKPFGMMELVSRVKALLRRAVRTGAQQTLTAGDVVLDSARHTVTVQGAPVTLTRKEFALLRILLANQGLVLERERLLQKVWGYAYDGGSRTVDVHIQTLRQKLDPCGGLIHTVRGVGYRLEGKEHDQ